MSKLPARAGWEWLGGGFALIRKQPGLLMTVAIGTIAGTVLAALFPLIGPFVAVIFGPCLHIAIMEACARIERGERVGAAVLLSGFRKPHLARLCKLGLVDLALVLVLVLVFMLSLSDTFIEQMRSATEATARNPAELVAALSESDRNALYFSMLGISLVKMASWLLLFFAAPLVYWQGMPTFKAIFYSVFGVLGSAHVFLVMLLAWFGMMMGVNVLVGLVFGGSQIGGVVSLWALLLFWLLLQCALFGAYRQIFGAPQPAPPQEPSAPVADA